MAIVGASGDTVATLVRNLRVAAYLRLCLAWNGRRGVARVTQGDGDTSRPPGICPAEPAFAQPSGRLAPAGDYRVRVARCVRAVRALTLELRARGRGALAR